MQTPHIGFPPETVAVFILICVGAIVLDMVMHRGNQTISLRSAACWSVFWIVMALAFAGFLYLHHGAQIASLFITGYALEKVLSVDNLFVIMAIFCWFGIPENYRHRVLYWGVIGAIVFRAIFVAIGTSLLALGPWVEVAFAIIVGWTAIMMLKGGKSDQIEDYSQHLAYRMVRKLYPLWPKLCGDAFFVNAQQVKHQLTKPENTELKSRFITGAKRYATPMLLCLAVVELSDVMFAFDSVPAVIAVSREPLIVYSAMMFAILGLRTLYFVLEGLKSYLIHLEKAVIVLLGFIAIKLAVNASDHFFHHGYEISANMSLMVVIIVLLLGVLASVLMPAKK